jgi:cardiolipin synthase
MKSGAKSGSQVLVRIGFVALGALIATVVALSAINLSPQQRQLSHDLHGVGAVTGTRFGHELAQVLGAPILSGNRIDDLENGGDIFPAMLDAIGNAKRSINFEDYIFLAGPTSHRFEHALEDRARAGVAVNVLVDWMGAWAMDDAMVERLRKAGVHFRYFHPLSWSTIGELNNRTHRRLLIVDGKVGFTGGAAIAQAWTGEQPKGSHWRDLEFRIEGPVVAQIQAIFEEHWITTTGQILLGDAYFPALQPAGDLDAQMFSSSPYSSSQNMQLMVVMAIDGARSSIDIESAYFIPDKLMMTALKNALDRGVKIRLVLPGSHVEIPFVQAASRASWGALLQAGARIWMYQRSRFHDKLMIVDRYLTVGGSANFDNRSFKLNDEANIDIFDHSFASRMTQVFEGDMADSRELTAAQWRGRSLGRKLGEDAAALTDFQL